jgi:hypothetical protein
MSKLKSLFLLTKSQPPWIRTFSMASFNLNYFPKVLPPNTIAFKIWQQGLHFHMCRGGYVETVAP